MLDMLVMRFHGDRGWPTRLFGNARRQDPRLDASHASVRKVLVLLKMATLEGMAHQ